MFVYGSKGVGRVGISIKLVEISVPSGQASISKLPGISDKVAFSADDADITGNVWVPVCGYPEAVERLNCLTRCGTSDAMEESRLVEIWCKEWRFPGVNGFLMIGTYVSVLGFLRGSHCVQHRWDYKNTYHRQVCIERIFVFCADNLI